MRVYGVGSGGEVVIIFQHDASEFHIEMPPDRAMTLARDLVRAAHTAAEPPVAGLGELIARHGVRSERDAA